MITILQYLLAIVIFYFVIETAVRNGINKSNIAPKDEHNIQRPLFKNDLDD